MLQATAPLKPNSGLGAPRMHSPASSRAEPLLRRGEGSPGTMTSAHLGGQIPHPFGALCLLRAGSVAKCATGVGQPGFVKSGRGSPRFVRGEKSDRYGWLTPVPVRSKQPVAV